MLKSWGHKEIRKALHTVRNADTVRNRRRRSELHHSYDKKIFNKFAFSGIGSSRLCNVTYNMHR